MIASGASPQAPNSDNCLPTTKRTLRTKQTYTSLSSSWFDTAGSCGVGHSPPHLLAAGSTNDESEAQPYTVASVKEFNNQVEELRRDSDKIIFSALPAVWAEIKETYGDTANYRLEYIEPLIIVTWPSLLHETFKEVVGAFETLEKKTSDFRCRFNESIEIPTGTGPKSEPVPNFVLARRVEDAADDEYLVILELAASQPEKSLENKALKWLSHPDVTLVIAINLQMDQYHSPDVSPPSPTLTWAQFLTATTPSPFGEISVYGHVYGPAITEIWAHLYTPAGNAQGYECVTKNISRPSSDATPTERNTHFDTLDEVSRSIAKATRRAVTAAVFDKCFEEADPFDLRWNFFYPGITEARRRDAYKRYKKACAKAGLPPQQPPAPSSTLKRDVSESEADEEAALEKRFKRVRRD